MNTRKTWVRFFTIADYMEEEVWLRDMHRSGWKLVQLIPPCFFVFEECVPEDMVYRMDYRNNSEDRNYYQILEDYGWDYVGRCVGWLYFRKPCTEPDSEQENELFSDAESRAEMIDHVIRTRLFPIMIVFLCCVVPNFCRSMNSRDPIGFGLAMFFAAMAGLYIYLIVHCGLKLRRLREECGRD